MSRCFELPGLDEGTDDLDLFEDDEFETYGPSPGREEVLGFVPQHEIKTNQLLPYAAELDEESNRFLEQVKTNLAKSVMLREMKPACGVWSSRLMKYIRVYGLKFSKEDHINLIKLTYELVIIPDLEPCKIHKFATMFLMLTKKKYLISPNELTLPWRPLHEVGKKIFDKSATHAGLYHYLASKGPTGNEESRILDMVRKFMSGYGLDDALHLIGLAGPDENELPTSLESSYTSMIKAAKPYFDVSATREILDEFLPQICPWVNDSQTLTHLSVFLPVALAPEYAAQGHQLWFDELMTLWDTCHNSQSGISDIMAIFAGLAKRNPGAIDWTPHVPKMFMRFLHALSLPVSYKDMQYSKNYSLYMKHIAAWIVWSLAPNGVVMSHLRSFLAAIESYLHSANTGRWTSKLRDLLRKLSREFVVRIRREKERKFQKGWENKTPPELKLRDEDITEFVSIVVEPALQAVYSRSDSLDVSGALHSLATLRPALVVPQLIDKLETSLSSLTEPHRVTAAMSAVAAVARPMLRGADCGYPEGPTHVVPLLIAVLPGIDPNDIKKTLVTLHFILMFSWMVPIIDCSAARDHWTLTEEELLTCESTAQFEDFVLVFLDRLFVIIESSVHENVRIESKESELGRSRTDAVMESAIASAATAVLMQCSPKIFQEALRKFTSFATTTFEPVVSGSIVGVLVRVFARVDSAATLAAFVPRLCADLTELLAPEEAVRDENPPRELLYRLVLLSNVVECDGTVLLTYMDQIQLVLDRALKMHALPAIQRACETLSHIFTSLSTIELKEWRSSAEDYGAAPATWLPVRTWGQGCRLKEARFQWHVPSAAEAECAQRLLERYLAPELARLRQWVEGERALGRERRLRCFYITNAVLACGALLPPPPELAQPLTDSLVPATDIPFTGGVHHTLTLGGRNVRAELTALWALVQERMLADHAHADDTRGFEALIAVWERIVGQKGLRASPGMEARMRSYHVLERLLDAQGAAARRKGGTARPRMLLADAARVQDDARLGLACDAGITPSALRALHALYDLSIHTYSSVRASAQLRLYWILSHYPYSYRELVGRVTALLAAGGAGEEWHARHKGALFVLLGPRAGPLIAKQDWEAARALWPAVLTAPLSEKPSILKLEQAFADTLHRYFPTVNTRLTVSAAAVRAAAALLAPPQLAEPQYAALVASAAQREAAAGDSAEEHYRQLVLALVAAAEAPGTPWRRHQLAMHMLACCPSLQTQYPAEAVRHVLLALIHDDIAVRRIAQRLAHYVLKQRKRPLIKVAVDPYEVAGVPRPPRPVPGYRPDLDWAMWAEDGVPRTDDDWDRPWLRDPSVGFYAWPRSIQVAAPTAQQTFSSDLSPEQMEDGERYIYEFFTDEGNVDKLVGFLTVEEKKGKDKFSGVRFAMFRMLFAQFGERVSERLLAHALRCAASPQEAPQRFAAELAAAGLRAPRYWPRQRALPALRAATAVVREGLGAVTPETMEDWGTCLATGVEKLCPRRGGEVLEALLELCAPEAARGDAVPDQHASFVVCARLYALQGALGSLGWRAAPYAAALLRRLDAANFIQHPYQNVRETVGSILMTIFDTELVFPGGSAGGAPRFAHFLESVRPRLAALYDENGDIIVKRATSVTAVECGAARQEAAAGAGPEPPVGLAGSAGCVAVTVARLAAGGEVEEAPPADGEEVELEESARGERFTKQLSARMDTALRLGGEGGASPAREYARAVSLLTTVLRACMGVIVRGINGSTAAQYSLVPTACALAARGPPQPHDELPRAADGFLASLARQHHSGEDFDAALDVLERVGDTRSWWARLACLDFAQPLMFYGLPMVRERPERAVRGERFALQLMRDPRLEVRSAAAKLLTGLMHCRALPNEERTLHALTQACRSREPVERHCGVLGLCAYLSSRPYALGPRLGAVLAELARHTGAPDPVPATLRAALADFRRTHHDDWPRHRARLTPEELDLLADLTAPPSYCV